jgi:hypothetical protein
MTEPADRAQNPQTSKVTTGVCGISCEKCPRKAKGVCPNKETGGCVPKDNPHCKIATCAHHRGVKFCFECSAFPCNTSKSGPFNYGFCQWLATKDINGL